MKSRRLTAIALAALAVSGAAWGSSHREAPFITKYPQADATDFYLFSSYEPGREGFVTMIANYQPLQAAYGGPNYFPLDSRALYEIHVDNDGDSREDLTYQFRFQNALPDGEAKKLIAGGQEITSVLRNITPVDANAAPGLSHVETFTLDLVRDGRSRRARPVRNADDGARTFTKPFDYSGTKTFGGPGGYDSYAQSFVYDVNLPDCSIPGRVFVGQRNEAFKISLGEVFDLVNLVPIEGDSAPGAGDGGGFPGGVTQDPQRNILARNNVTSLALEVHKSCLMSNSSTPVVGAWTSASLRQVNILNPRPTFATPEIGVGGFTQVSRLSSPLVNELVIGYDKKDSFNNSKPRDDSQFLTFVTNPGLPVILDALFRDAVNSVLSNQIDNLAPTNFPRNDLVAAFLTGFPGLNQFPDGVPGEMLRLNTLVPVTERADQSPLGLIGGDLSGFPNGRRPGDDSVDIALRVVMGALCYPIPVGPQGDLVNLGICDPDDAPVGNVPFTDGAPLSAAELNGTFPYLLTPYPGSPVGAPLPQPAD